MEQIIKNSARVEHLAGVIPVAAPPLDFNMPWHDSLMPLGPDYTAVERSVCECVMAGCSTIWIVSHVGTQPLLRKRIGDYVYKPLPKMEDELRKTDELPINVFYVPIHPKDKHKRDSLGWSALYAANIAYRTCAFISKWVAPEKYYCSFPYGVCAIEFVKENRREIMKPGKNVLFSSGGKTVKDDQYCSFTFNAEDYKKCRDYIKEYYSNSWDQETEKHKYRNATHLELSKIFSLLDSENSSVIEYPWFYGIGSWSDYSKFVGSGISLQKDYRMFSNRKREIDDVARRGRTLKQNKTNEEGK